jgi:hypothetical protein
VVLALVLAPQFAPAAEKILLRARPVPGLVAEVTADGTLLLRSGTADEPILVSAFAVASGRRRPGRLPQPHIARTHEGDPAGHRGFSGQADDDGDGWLDEDPLDGRDNDGDGAVDEDHAAIGDDMLVVDLGAATGRIEYYRWAHPHLQGTVFAAAVAGPQAPGPVSWRLTGTGSEWTETRVRGLHHRVNGRRDVVETPAFVSHVAARPGAAAVWLAVAVLDEPVDDGAGRIVLDRRQLSINLGEAPLAVTVVAADTWLGLVRRLTDAAVVRAGVSDPVSGQRVGWVVPPPCAPCRDAAAAPFRWRLDRQGHLVLGTDLHGGGIVGVDPDRFRIGSAALGAPDQILWRPPQGDEQGIGWYAMDPVRLSRTGVGLADPYLGLGDAAGHRADGELAFLFRTPDPDVVARLTGGGGGKPAAQLEVGLVNAGGVTRGLEPDLNSADPVRSALTLALAAEAVPATSPGDQERLLRSDRAPILAPELLHGWPNPFRDQITLRLRVPATVGEAFTWDKDAGPPAGLDPAASVPWSTGEPSVTVKIYSLSGRELRTLHEGSHGVGEVTVTWDGTDAYGRKVASGTYFCKLQMDDWSTTRRVVFMR